MDNPKAIGEALDSICCLAEKLERERDSAIATIVAIEEIYIDGCDTYEDWKAMGELARAALILPNAEATVPQNQSHGK